MTKYKHDKQFGQAGLSMQSTRARQAADDADAGRAADGVFVDRNHHDDWLRETILSGLDSPLSSACALQERDTLNAVRRALDNNDATLAFQSVVDARHAPRVAFYEGLIRLNDGSGRIIPAREFIHTCETSELGRLIDCRALELGLRALQQNPSIRLSINMSARSIGYPCWTETLERGLAADPSVGERLIIEITEASAMIMPDITCVFMERMQTRGISFALDDFGAGYTSFRYLKDFYFDIIKIDGQFINGIHRDPDNRVLTEALISIARHFDMFTVAESVEQGEDAALLLAMGIDCMQGHYFGAPSSIPPWTRVPR